jgi:hypothetical protein
MKRRTVLTGLLTATVAMPLVAAAQPGPGPGAGMGPDAGRGPGPGAGMGMQRWSRERMYGAPMMTLEERQAHQRQMWNAKTVEERNQIREAHRKQMLERARQRNFSVDEKQDDVYSVPALPK